MAIGSGGQAIMAQLLVRDVDEDLVRRLERRAAAAGRSAEAEHLLILERALRPDDEDRRRLTEFKERARRLRERTRGRSTLEGWEIIREDRDRNYEPPDDVEPGC
jgi:antitoxin FitA